jgi:serine protease Do
MNSDQELFELLERFLNGELSPDERALLENKMDSDVLFRTKVEEHVEFLRSVRQYGEREKIKSFLDTFHRELSLENPLRNSSQESGSVLSKNLWSLLGVAASVAVFCIIGTWFVIDSMEPDSKSNFRELRRSVEMISKSQRVIIKDLADINKELKEKEPAPGNYAGTGFVVSPNGYLATSFHVIKDADSVYIENPFYGRLKTSVFVTDKGNDIAILRIEDESIKIKSLPYMISPDEADLGEDVFTLGFPREDIVYGNGTVSASTGFHQQAGAYQVTVPVNPGNSGGPLLDHEGNLIGIISGMQTETEGAAFATKSTILLNVIQSIPTDSLGKSFQLPRTNRLRSYNRVQQIKKLKEFVFVVKVYNTH